MKKYIFISTVIISIFTLNGCGSYSDGYEDGYYDGVRDYGDNMVSLFLVDQDGFSAGGVVYSCIDEDNNFVGEWITKPNGEFSFYIGERCTFDLEGYNGTPDDPLFIEDDIGSGKEDIPYECEQGDAGFTNRYGSFDYLQDDRCTFYF
ncbi:MAG: hypothetical protein ABGW74_00135 [Campylobacterales bacterium]